MVNLTGYLTKSQEATLMQIAKATGERTLSASEVVQPQANRGKPYIQVMGNRGKMTIIVGFLPVKIVGREWEKDGDFSEALM